MLQDLILGQDTQPSNGVSSPIWLCCKLSFLQNVNQVFKAQFGGPWPWREKMRLRNLAVHDNIHLQNISYIYHDQVMVSQEPVPSI